MNEGDLKIGEKKLAFARKLWFCGLFLALFSSSIWNVLKVETSAINRAIYYTLLNLMLIPMGMLVFIERGQKARTIFAESLPKNDEFINCGTKKSDQCKKVNQINWVTILLKIARSAYFSHNTLLIWFYAKTRHVIYIDSLDYVS